MRQHYFYTRAHVYNLRRRCRQARMSAPPGFWIAPVTQLRACYNGIGPDAWSLVFRGWVTRKLKVFESSALPHDYEYATAPRTFLHFTIANARFIVNAALEAWERKRPSIAWHGFWLALCCQCFGWRGFRAIDVAEYAQKPKTRRCQKCANFR